MPEMLQSRSVRKDVGNKWIEWAVKNSRLARSCDASTDRGLTRIEVSYYMDDNELDLNLSMCASLISSVTNLFTPELIYKTSHSSMWKAYCDCFKHTLIVANPQFGATIEHIRDINTVPKGCALLLYSFNHIMGDISGRFIDNWNMVSRHVIERHTLSSTLPVDIIEVCNYKKVMSNEKGNSLEIHVTKNRYSKSRDLPLYITKLNTVFNRTCYTKDEK